MIALKPLPGHALVELREEYEHLATAEKKYDTRTSGILKKINVTPNFKEADFVINTRVFWEEYKDGKMIERDGKKYAFIKIEDLTGYEDE